MNPHGIKIMDKRRAAARHHDAAQAQLVVVALVAGIVIGIATLAIVIGALQ